MLVTTANSVAPVGLKAASASLLGEAPPADSSTSGEPTPLCGEVAGDEVEVELERAMFAMALNPSRAAGDHDRDPGEGEVGAAREDTSGSPGADCSARWRGDGACGGCGGQPCGRSGRRRSAADQSRPRDLLGGQTGCGTRGRGPRFEIFDREGSRRRPDRGSCRRGRGCWRGSGGGCRGHGSRSRGGRSWSCGSGRRRSLSSRGTWSR